MASTYSNLKIQLMATGENSGTWGNVTNVNLGTALEQALVETATVSVSGGDATLTLSDTNARQDARALRLNVTGASVARVVNVPAIEKPYLVNNAGSAAVTVKVSGQTGIAVPAGKTMWVYNNGTDVVDAITHLTSLTLASALAAASGGTGLNAAGTSGNLLTSNGSAWVSQAPASSGFDSGTVMLFAQTSAPTGWTKNTSTGNNHALRVVTGSASTGGSVDFTTAFASQSVSGTVTVTASTGQTAAPVSVGNTTLSTPQIPAHKHNLYARGQGPSRGRFSAQGADEFQSGTDSALNLSPFAMNNTGGGGSHTHPGSGGQHSHPVSAPASFSGSAINLAVKYVDVIRATKD